MLIHHLAANCLYFCYIFGGLVPYGAIVAYLHDLADIPTNFAKVLTSTTFKIASVIDGIIVIVLWAYTRCYLLPQCVYNAFANWNFKGDEA